MAATTTVTLNPVKITVTGTSENTIDLDAVMVDSACTALIEWVSGTTIQFNANDKAITAASAAINSTQTKLIVDVQKGQWLRCKGGAGSETFNITIID